ncbi:Cbp1 family collagen-binding glycoprotein adhesin [Chlorobium sp.]|uniref:Cbp1 family collagen-binding glycoprotein adhesin n=1 Tax=Chlorobium sp. TaxID=1095 RepID=UPI002F8FEFA6
MDSMAVNGRKGSSAAVLAVFMVLLLLFVGCKDTEKARTDPRQQHMESMMAILAQVQKNLARIQQKEAVVERLSSDIEKKDSRDAEQIGRDIYSSIRFIDSTLTASKALIATLESENRKSLYRVESLDKLTTELKTALNDKDSEVRKLKGQVQQLSGEVSSLMKTVDVLDEFIQEQGDQLYTAYYIGGTFEELVAKGILVTINPIEKFFGNQYRISPDFDVQLFRKLDITETRDIYFSKPLKSLRIITPHTTGSYELAGGSTSSLLLIRDENEFWKKSRCLVIVYE